MALKSNKNTFIEKAREIHGDKYDYSKVEYANNHTKVCIICPIHGEFFQTPGSHLSNRGCPKCKGNRISKSLSASKEDFIEKARKIHGDKYDYSRAEYKNNKTKVCIICPKHGEFWQTPDNHINNKAGCPKCKGERLTEINTRVWDDLIKKMRAVHGDKFEYDESTYINSHRKIRIICPIHGEFWQTPNSHLLGHGCNKCGGKSVTNLKEFITKAKEIHGNKYDYSKVEYTNTDSKVCIICPIHGEFWQTPHIHLRGVGCPVCKESHLEKEVVDNLKSINTSYTRGKHLNWLGKQHLDFYLPKYNIAIECQGEQHFGLGGWAKGKRFDKIKELDIRKKQLCEEHGVKLYYFSHENFDEFLGEKVYHNIGKLLGEIQNSL